MLRPVSDELDEQLGLYGLRQAEHDAVGKDEFATQWAYGSRRGHMVASVFRPKGLLWAGACRDMARLLSLIRR